jgi:hypothetical protein
MRRSAQNQHSRAEADAAASPIRAAARRHAGLLAVAAAALAAVLVISAATAPPARAASIAGIDINPLDWPGELFSGISGGIAKLAVSGFDAIVKALFAPIAKFITTQLIGWLLTVPNLTQGNVSQLQQTVEAMAGGMLGAVATISTIRYWAAGFAGGGDSGFAALEGLTRTVAAALFLAVWPWLFDSSAHLTNLFTDSLMGSGPVVHSVSHLLAAGLGAGIALSFTPIGLFLNIAMAVAASLLFLGLLLVKIVLSISTILIFVGMPLAVVLWPVVPWIARLALRAFAVCLIVPAVWALCFAACAAVSLNALSFNASTVMNTLLQPLVAIVLLWVMLRLPIHLARVAMLGAMPLGGGIVSRAVSYAAGSQIRDTAQAHLPGWAGRSRQGEAQASQAESAGASRPRTAATLAGAAATGTATASAAGVSPASDPISATSTGGAGGAMPGAAASGRSYTPPPTAQANTAGQPLQNGLQTPSFAGREQDFQNETFEAQHRAQTDPVSAEQATAALQSLPQSTQRGVGQLVSDHGEGALEHLAYQAMGEWSPQQREALRTLAAATPEVRQQAISDTLAGSDASAPAAGAVPLAAGDERSGEAFSDPTSRPAQPPTPADQPPAIADHSQPQAPGPASPHSPPDGESSRS